MNERLIVIVKMLYDNIAILISIAALVISYKAYKKSDEHNFAEFYQNVHELSGYFEYVEKAFDKNGSEAFMGTVNAFKLKLKKSRKNILIPKKYHNWHKEINELLDEIPTHGLHLSAPIDDDKVSEETKKNDSQNNKSIESIIIEIRKRLDRVNS